MLVQLLGEVFAGILCSDRCASLSEVPQGRGPVLLGALQTQYPGRTGNRQDNRRRTLLPRRSGAACAPVPAMASFSRRTRCPIWPHHARTTDRKSIPLEKKFFALADRYLDSRDKDVANLALALLQHFERFFAFLRYEGVEPTNNVAERALRCAVQWRKISFGSRSAQGEVAVARLLTATRTCRMQNHSPAGLPRCRPPVLSQRVARPVAAQNSFNHLNCYKKRSTGLGERSVFRVGRHLY